MQTQIHGGDIYSREYRIDFSANINPFGMPESVKRAAIEGVERSIHYPDVQCRRLLEKLSKKEQVPKEWILCTNGAAELLFALCQTLKPKKALLAAPGFAEYEQAVKASGAECVFFYCSKEEKFHLTEDYLDDLTDEIDILFLCNPNNPTGTLIDEELLNRILKKCSEKEIFAVVDECFLDFVREDLQNSQKLKLRDMKNLLILKAFTKMYGMPGLRLGYGMCSDESLLSRMRQVLQPWNVSLPAQLAGEAAISEEEFVKRTRDYVSKEREFLTKEMIALGFQVYDSAVNYLFFEGPKDLYDFCAGKGILIRDCSNYRGLRTGYYRIAVKTREENRELLRVLESYAL